MTERPHPNPLLKGEGEHGRKFIVGIDGNEANVEKKVGISEYAFELLIQFKKIQDLRFKIQVYLKEKPRPDMPKEGPNWEYIIVGPKKLWTQIGLPLYLFTHFSRPDVFFSPSHYAPRFSPIPTAISIMDVSYLHFPELFAKKDLYQLKSWTAYSARSAKRIFTISEASKNDILKAYGKNPGDVIVTYPGIKEISNFKFQMSNFKSIQEKYNLSNSYILFVGTLQPRKNIERLIEAFSKLKKNPHPNPLPGKQGEGDQGGNGLQLVIVGKKGWLYEPILEAPKKLGISHAVKFLEFVSDDDLPTLYKNAVMFVLPSLYEGFGLPVVEAMKYGTPVITSNVSSLPEAGGNAALYVNPEDVADIAEKMQKLLDNPKLREELVKKGYQHIKQFSWEKAAKETLNVLTNIARSS